jgi:hypothetical protein
MFLSAYKSCINAQVDIYFIILGVASIGLGWDNLTKGQLIFSIDLLSAFSDTSLKRIFMLPEKIAMGRLIHAAS